MQRKFLLRNAILTNSLVLLTVWPTDALGADETSTIALRSPEQASSFPWSSLTIWPRYLIIEESLASLAAATLEADRLREELQARAEMSEQEARLRVNEAIDACQRTIAGSMRQCQEEISSRYSLGTLLLATSAGVVVGAILGALLAIYH